MPVGSWGVINPYAIDSGGFEVRVQYRGLDGVTKRKKFRGKSKTAAAHAARQALPMLVSEFYGNLFISPETSFASLAEMWIDELQSDAAYAGSWREEASLVNIHIIPKLGQLTIREIRPSTLLVFYHAVLKEAPAQARQIMVQLRKICRKGVQLDVILINPAEHVGR
jgi:hypothetical protein